MTAFRIADARRPIFDGTGAQLHGGRWNSPGRPVIYAAESYATAMLEVLAHANLSIIPRHHAFVRIDIPEHVRIETLDSKLLPGWPVVTEAFCRRLGDAWLAGLSSVALRVPSIVTAGHENNLLLNPMHQDFRRIRSTAPAPVVWDPRLFPATR